MNRSVKKIFAAGLFDEAAIRDRGGGLAHA